MKALGCENVVYVTRRGGDSLFGTGVAKRILGETTIFAVPDWNLLVTQGTPEDIKNSNIHVRIKAQANTGQSLYSSAVNVSNICNGRLELALYPNPVTGDISEVMINTVEGIFNGTYTVRLLNADGKELNKKEVRLINQSQMKYQTGFLPGGSYHLVITGEDSQAHSLKFIKQ